MYRSYSNSQSNTYTEARAQYINGKVYDDTQAMAIRGLIPQTLAESWRRDIQYLLDNQVMSFFQFQFILPNGTRKALQYNLKNDGSIHSDEVSGGVNYWSFPEGTKVTLFVHLNEFSPNYHKVMQKLADDGWGTGNSITGNSQYDRSYSKDGYGLNRNKINW